MMTDDRLYPLPPLRYLHLRFILQAETEARLPEFKGSMLRGAFGHALKRTVCAMGPEIPCSKCMLKGQCAFTRLFETFIQGEPPRFLRGLDTAPRPIIFDPGATPPVLQAGDPLPFELKLLGSAVDFLPYVVFAVLQMAQSGLGAQRHPFTLTEVHCLQPNDSPDHPLDWATLYDARTQSLLFAPTPLQLPSSPPFSIQHSKFIIRFLTPIRLKFDGRYSLDFNFRALVFKMLRRVLELVYFYEPKAEINWEFHDLLVAADDVHITRHDLHWADQQRYSNRQQTKMMMGGFIGELELEGNLQPFLDLISTAEVLHIGKGTVFGLGKMKMLNSE